MRGIVLRESLPDRSLPLPMPVVLTGSYPHLLDRRIPVEVLEVQVAPGRAAEVAVRLAAVLAPRGWYAHLIDDELMIVIFPGVVVQVRCGDEAAAERARAIGAFFGIPDRQMRFQDMFVTDHPDSDQVEGGDRGRRAGV
ncbi:hypothetical protein [Nocardia cyriacigeorgica]|uniref:hypothetical protein n=1 Tax=Nocardia cyriacigeorgica TaxID=135487 RepID=UPI00245423B5|nr:hypothetical protein [Nocardia cyriacigeorgica]